MLYDDENVFPRWLFTLGFYRVSLAAVERWGSESVVVDELSRKSFEHAVQHGDFVFVASHGMYGFVLSGNSWIQPDDVLATHVGTRLRMVYLTACDAGRNLRWKEVLAPAEVRSFDRVSAVLEHVGWLWIWGPREFTRLGFDS